MEFLIAFVTIAVIAVILGVSVEMILFAVLGIFALIMTAAVLFFIKCGIELLQSERCKGEYIRTDKAKGHSYPCAYYKIGEEEYPCALPGEFVLKNRFYKKNKTVSLMFFKKKKCVYDLNALCTVTLGLTVGTAVAVMLILYMIKLYG